MHSIKQTISMGLILGLATGLTGCQSLGGSDRAIVHHLASSAVISNVSLSRLRMFSTSYGWAINTADQIIQTANGGVTWRLDSPHASQGYTLVAEDILTRSSMWAVYSNQKSPDVIVYHTNNSGRTWIKTEGLHIAYPGGALEMDFVNNMVGYFINILPAMGVEPAFLYRTKNGGRTWETASHPNSTGYSKDGFFNTYDHSIPFGGSIIFSDAHTGWLYGQPRAIPIADHGVFWLFRTGNGGQTWTHVAPPLPKGGSRFAIGITDMKALGFQVLNMAVVLNGNEKKVQIQKNYLYMSRNGGHTWNYAPMPNGVLTRMQFINPSVRCALYGWHQLMMSKDGGSQWETVKTPIHTIWGMDFLTPKLGWVFNTNTVWKTMNGGKTWNRVSVR